MKLHVVSLAILALCVCTVVAEDADKYKNKTRPCGPKIFAKLDTCCSMPKLLPFETFKNCFGGNVDNKVVAKEAFSGKVRNTRAVGDQKTKKNGRKIKPGRRSYGPKNGPMCLIECVLRNESLLTANNEVDIAAIKARFIQSAGDKWKTQVETQVDSCWSDLKKVDFSKYPPPPEGMVTCKPHAAMLMSCVRRQLILNCVVPKNEDASCPAKKEKLKKCDPFAIPPPREPKGEDGEEEKKANKGEQKSGGKNQKKEQGKGQGGQKEKKNQKGKNNKG